jgi:hypothetical protein
MDTLAAINREERKLEKQLGKLNHQLSGLRAASKSVGTCRAGSSLSEEAHPVGGG